MVSMSTFMSTFLSLWLLPGRCSHGRPTIAITGWSYTVKLVSWMWPLNFLITSNVCFYNDDYEWYGDVYVHGHSFWVTDLGCLKPGKFDSITAHLPWYLCPCSFFLNIRLNIVTFELFYDKIVFSIRIFYRGVPCFWSDCPYGVSC